jgi:uncharacterized protein (UPF0276 family)
MIKLATPVSHLFNDESIAEEICAASDCLEGRERNWKLQFPRQTLMHWDMEVNHNWNLQSKEHIKNVLLSMHELELVSFHIASNCEQPVVKNRMFWPGGYQYSRKEMLVNCERNIAWLRSFLNRDIKLAIENNNFYPTPVYDIVAEGEFLTQVVNENEINFLCDIAHSMVSAHNLKIDFQGYFQSLPLDKAIQLHVCQPDLSEEIGFDTHERPNASIFLKVEQILQQYPIGFVTIEYYKDKEILVQLLNQFRTLIINMEEENES